ncbi:MAG: hypothetical protein IPM47_01215 [Sphingobacteriales bacterium]|nr:MAG: hypothetical protein IPM47_01215 [Sphingobacteriales bacterium]
MKKMLMGILLLSFLFTSNVGCKKEKSFEEKYAGAWEITFSGSFSGEKTIIVKSDGSFNFSIVLQQGLFGSVTNSFTGFILESGAVEGDIFMSGNDIGDVSGNLEDNGTGEGIYVTNVPTSGTWEAVKL